LIDYVLLPQKRPGAPRGAQLVVPHTHRPIFIQNAVHFAQRGQIPGFVEYHQLDFVGRLVGEPFAVELGQTAHL